MNVSQKLRWLRRVLLVKVIATFALWGLPALLGPPALLAPFGIAMPDDPIFMRLFGAVVTAGLSASLGVTGTGETVVELKWERSPEDGEGENDVIRYVVWRRPAGSGDWGTPYLSIPAGKERYLYRDADLVMGEAYQYAIAAQDCTPTLSAMAVARPITVPLK